MKKKILYSIAVTGVSLITCVGIVYAASFTGEGTVPFDSIRIGQQGVGGVTFFNGTIVNETTAAGDADNPVTFGDNVRIDGRVFRGATAGTADTMPFIVNDNMEVTGSLTIGSLASTGVIDTTNLADDAVTTAKIDDGTIATADLADDAVTTAKILGGAVTQAVEDSQTQTQTTTESGGDYDIAAELDITTGESNLFCIFSGYGTVDAEDQAITIAILLDDEIIDRTARKQTNGGGNGFVTLTTSAIFEVESGDHTVQLGWNTVVGQEASLYANTLDCIELKR
ncbi:MAG: hypothetical protein ABIB97_05725 [Patescibacteria group bacterium]